MRIRRTFPVIGLIVLAGVVIPPIGASARHGGAAAQAYRGHASGAALHADALTNADLRLTDIEVGIADAAVDSTGLRQVLNAHQRTVAPAENHDKHSRARSSLLEVGAGLQPPSAANQLAPLVAVADAPGRTVVDESALDQTVSTLADVSLARRIAAANWFDATCVLGEPIARGEQHLARVELLETSDEEAADPEPGFQAAVLGLAASSGGPRRAATHVASTEQLYAGSGGRFGLLSAVSETLAPVTFFEGTDNEFTIEVDGPAALAVAANGTAGGAHAIYRAPAVAVVQDGDVTQVAPSEPVLITVPTTGQPIARVILGAIEPLPDAGLDGRMKKSDGTKAAAQAHVVEVVLLDGDLRGATVALGHMEAAAEVPAGGIECSIPVRKHASPRQVTPGERFTTRITVDNPWPCTITTLSLVDEITVEQGARFQIREVDAGGSAPSGSNLPRATVRWPSLGSLGPGEERMVKIKQTAQGSAGIIADTAEARGSLSDCATGFDAARADVTSLAQAAVEVGGRGTLKIEQVAVLGERILPATGLGAPLLGGGLMLGAAAMLARRLRRPVER